MAGIELAGDRLRYVMQCDEGYAMSKVAEVCPREAEVT